ncbi:MAG TPA: hypothetical protein DCM01_05560 [Dielma fastidiosa]|nr:hypothetical protein [Dielma fastidiosa]
MEKGNKTLDQLNAEGKEFVEKSMEGIERTTFRKMKNGYAALYEIVQVLYKYDLTFYQARRLLSDIQDFLEGCKFEKNKMSHSECDM